MEPLSVSLAHWILGEGIYAVFEAGEEYAFALEFYAPETLRSVRRGRRAFSHRHDAQFDVVGRSTFLASDWWVIDFGVAAYTINSLPAEHKPGKLFEGSVHVGVDHGRYLEDLSRRPNSPPLFYDWRVERIEVLTGPFLDQGKGAFLRDADKTARSELERTVSNDPDAEYILHCTLLDAEPRRTLRR